MTKKHHECGPFVSPNLLNSKYSFVWELGYNLSRYIFLSSELLTQEPLWTNHWVELENWISELIIWFNHLNQFMGFANWTDLFTTLWLNDGVTLIHVSTAQWRGRLSVIHEFSFCTHMVSEVLEYREWLGLWSFFGVADHQILRVSPCCNSISFFSLRKKAQILTSTKDFSIFSGFLDLSSSRSFKR